MKACNTIYLTLFLCCGCISKQGQQKEAKSTVKAQNYKMLAQIFVQAKSAQSDDNTLRFQTRLSLTKQQFDENKTLQHDLQYGVDSAFVLVSRNDTIWPSYVMPIGNGQMLTPQFIVAFDKAKLSGSESVHIKAAIRSLVSPTDSGIFFNLGKIGVQYK